VISLVARAENGFRRNFPRGGRYAIRHGVLAVAAGVGANRHGKKQALTPASIASRVQRELSEVPDGILPAEIGLSI
jgi:hypothetical protein